MPDISNDERAIADLLRRAKTIAVVGMMPHPHKASYRIPAYMRDQGYTIYPVNHVYDKIDGETVYASLDDIPTKPDIINVFRGARHLPLIFDQALQNGAGAVWAQLGIEHEDAAKRAALTPVQLVMNRCIMVDHRRLFS